MPLLTDGARQRLVTKGKEVYSAYTALNLATDPRGKTKLPDGQFFNAYLQKRLASAPSEEMLIIDGKEYKVALVKDNQNFKVVITNRDGSALPEPSVKSLDDY